MSGSTSARMKVSSQKLSSNSRSKLAHFGSLVKVEHTIFSAPLALLGMVLAADGFPPLTTIALIALALVAARTAAMAFNRIVDLDFDRRNPRTANRELVSGLLKPWQALTLVLVSATVFVLAAFALNPLCGQLSFLALFIVLGYSYTKRFTWLSHFALGLALGIAPGAAWLAVGAPLTMTPVILGLITVFWVAGFDILYSLADKDFDRQLNLRSIPAAFGTPKALLISRLLHLFCVGLMVYLFVFLSFPLWSIVALAPVALLFVRQHSLVSATDLSRLDMAFFTVNGWLGVLFALATAAMRFLL